jgi:hypothetical protein
MLILSKPAAAGLDSATTAWVAAVVAADGTVSGARQTLVNNLIVGLKADGVWAKLDRLWIFAAENHESALIDLFALAQALPSSGITFTVDRGYTGNGTTGIIRTLFNAATMGVKYTRDAAHMAAWDNVDRADAPTVITGVGDDFGVFTDLMPLSSNSIIAHVNGGGGGSPTNVGTSQGFSIGQRNSNSQTEYFHNGVSKGTTELAAAYPVISVPFYVCARNDHVGDGSGFMTDQVSMVSYGGNFTSTEALAYYNRLRTYMTAVGVP